MLTRFQTRKQKILEQLAAPDEEYHDLSPKGSVDTPIRDLIEDINGLDGLATTSSCSGRMSVFLEGRKADANGSQAQAVDETPAGPGGKGGGGLWLYISHDPLTRYADEDPNWTTLFGLRQSAPADKSTNAVSRYIHLKFEPMILHILAASLDDCQRVLTAALNAGFRESGAVSLTPSKSGELNPIVAVRSTGFSYDAIIGYQNNLEENVSLVDEQYLRTLVHVANERFQINAERIARFRTALLEQYHPRDTQSQNGSTFDWEDAEARKQRKREEGLARQQALKAQSREKYKDDTQETVSDAGFNAMFD
ncbi:hypothetical protein N0V90_005675 [Kalmusia sp. IMI 367209]|nr:hypothetical protein N0V90_005675 [Kalmusia sp. IMI 367209]